MVGPYEGLSLIYRNRCGSGRTHFSGRLRLRRFWLEYRIHGLTHEFKRDAKRFLSLSSVGTSSWSSMFVFLIRLNLQLGILNGTRTSGARPSRSKGRKALTLTLKVIGKILLSLTL